MCPSRSVLYTSMNVATGTRSPSWPYEHTVCAEIDSKEPQVQVGKTVAHGWALGDSGPACLLPRESFISHWALRMASSALWCREERGCPTRCTPHSRVHRAFFPWMSLQGLSPWSLHIHPRALQGQPSGHPPWEPRHRMGKWLREMRTQKSVCFASCELWVLQGLREEREKGINNGFEKSKTKNFSNLKKETNI